MKKLFIITMMLVASVSTFAESYEVRQAPSANSSSEYYLDRKFGNRDASTYAGIITRFGYSFSDNGYFSYGASFYYTFNSVIGITAGFDGYSGNIYVYNENNEIVAYDGPNKSLPMWDIRAGVVLGRYIAIGMIYGQCKVCTGDVKVVHKYNTSVTRPLDGHGNFLGAFGTVMLPISTHCALNVDLSYTNHTSFTLTGGLIIKLKVK